MFSKFLEKIFSLNPTHFYSFDIALPYMVLKVDFHLYTGNDVIKCSLL